MEAKAGPSAVVDEENQGWLQALFAKPTRKRTVCVEISYGDTLYESSKKKRTRFVKRI